MATTISVSEETRKRLQRIKLREGQASLDALLNDLIAEHQVAKLRAVQEKFAARAKELGLRVEDIYPDMLE